MDKESLTRAIALWQSPYGGYVSAGPEMETADRYVRVTEYVTVVFPERDDAEYVAEQMAALDAQEKKVQAEAERLLNEIRRRKAELLALPYVEV